jgi:MFS family permease
MVCCYAHTHHTHRHTSTNPNNQQPYTTTSYDLGVAGGVAAMPTFQRKFFPAVYERVSAPMVHGADDAYCKFDDQLLSLFVSVLFLAGIPGALVGSLVSRRFGRRPTMMLGCAHIFFCVRCGWFCVPDIGQLDPTPHE